LESPGYFALDRPFRWRLLAAGTLALVVAYPCFRFRIIGHYFALVTLALSGIVLQVITATRDYTGGSLGYTPERTKGSVLAAIQFVDKDDLVSDCPGRLGVRARQSGTGLTAA
jgi:ABC-type branched-subunit amino acid transport system permease subunit